MDTVCYQHTNTVQIAEWSGIYRKKLAAREADSGVKFVPEREREREREGVTACWSGAGATAEKCQVPLRIDEAAGEEEEGETEQRRSESPKRTKRTGGGKRQRRNQRSVREGGERRGQRTKKTPLENGLGRVCGEPVARQ